MNRKTNFNATSISPSSVERIRSYSVSRMSPEKLLDIDQYFYRNVDKNQMPCDELLSKCSSNENETLMPIDIDEV
jgi:hypothetical protein